MGMVLFAGCLMMDTIGMVFLVWRYCSFFRFIILCLADRSLYPVRMEICSEKEPKTGTNTSKRWVCSEKVAETGTNNMGFEDEALMEYLRG